MKAKSLQLLPRLGLVAAMLVPWVVAGQARAQEPAAAGTEMINPGSVKWGDAPPSMPKGAKLAVLYGDPGKDTPYVIRLKTPAGYKIAPHWHTQAENLTVISGTLYLGPGDKMDTAHARALKTGGYHYLPAKAHHYAFSKTETVVQIHGTGPLDINYVDPKDNPSGK